VQFEFAASSRIVFGYGRFSETVSIAGSLGTRVFLVSGTAIERADRLEADLRAAGLDVARAVIDGEPGVPAVLKAVDSARAAGSDVVVALGGGSVLDAAKAVSALLTNGGDLLDYLEVVGRGKPITSPAAPCIAIPTTSGTGSEVTKNAVLASPEHRVKASLRSPLMVPRVAIVDPQLTETVPPRITANTGLDALTQLIEPYVSIRRNPLTDALCREGIRRAAGSIRAAFRNGRDRSARENMAVASLFGGLALANAGLGAVHGLAAPLGGMFPAPHGAVCARLLPFVFEANVRALSTRGADGDVLRRFDEVAALLTGDGGAAAHQGVDWLCRLIGELEIEPLSHFGLTAGSVPDVIAQAQRASSMKANPLPLTDDELAEVLSRAL
jgi:alcohol dehydrogenase class IV